MTVTAVLYYLTMGQETMRALPLLLTVTPQGRDCPCFIDEDYETQEALEISLKGHIANNVSQHSNLGLLDSKIHRFSIIASRFSQCYWDTVM